MKKQDTEIRKRAGISPRAMSEYQTMTEIQLIESCQGRDRTAFQYLVKRHKASVDALLFRLAPDMTDRSDLTQEVLLRLWTSIGALRNPYAFRKWINQIATNVFYDELRRHRYFTVSIDTCRGQEDHDEPPVLQIADKRPLPFEMAQYSELRRVEEAALLRMPYRSRMLILLRDMQGFSYKEVSRLTHANIGTVKSRIARARAKMRRLISPYMTDEELATLKGIA